MAVINIPSEYGYVVLVALAFYIQQAIIFSIPVGIQRSKTGIKPPVLYPSDKLVSSLKLSDAALNAYMCAQRVHQNGMEFLHAYLPLLLLSGLHNPTHAAAAGALVWVGRLISAFGYWHKAEYRIYGAWFHIPELYTLYLVGSLGWSLVNA